MRGIDIARYQGKVDFNKVKNAGYEFVFQKCTEGVGYTDPMYLLNKASIRNAGLLFGAYHFARCTDAVKEADYFVSQLGDLNTGEIVILDYESYLLSDPATWCLTWLNRVEEKLGFKPILYTYHAILNKYNWTKVSSNNNGLWAARYGLQEQTPNLKYQPATGSWIFYAIWQYCSKGIVPGIVGNVDLDTTDMAIDTLKKYGKKEAVCNHLCPKHCLPI